MPTELTELDRAGAVARGGTELTERTAHKNARVCSSVSGARAKGSDRAGLIDVTEGPRNAGPRGDRTAAEWRARFAVAVATQRHVYGYPPVDARRRGYFDLLVEWTDADPALRELPSGEAEPLARAALEELGIVEPLEVPR